MIADTISVVNQTLGNNETWLYAFQFGSISDMSWSFHHKDLYCDVKNDPSDPLPMLSCSTVYGTIIILDADARIARYNVDDEVIFNSLPAGVYSYDLVMVDQTTDDTQRLMTGTLTIVEGSTKPTP